MDPRPLRYPTGDKNLDHVLAYVYDADEACDAIQVLEWHLQHEVVFDARAFGIVQALLSKIDTAESRDLAWSQAAADGGDTTFVDVNTPEDLEKALSKLGDADGEMTGLRAENDDLQAEVERLKKRATDYERDEVQPLHDKINALYDAIDVIVDRASTAECFDAPESKHIRALAEAIDAARHMNERNAS
jgi:hypothetical protein